MLYYASGLQKAATGTEGATGLRGTGLLNNKLQISETGYGSGSIISRKRGLRLRAPKCCRKELVGGQQGNPKCGDALGGS